MLYLITGGSGSGKSEYAETLAVQAHREHADDGALYYIATMYPYDGECLARIARHQEMRRNKGFTTKECYCGLDHLKPGKEDVLLLECMSNLLANEMYLEQGRIKARGEASLRQLEEAVLTPLLELERRARLVVVVTNEVFSDGAAYDQETEAYVKLLGRGNRKLAACADSVVEVVCAIPVARKGGLPCSNR